ncbi:hypothetical protein BLNAU_7557 [Blattamonas nauphoetae]|uniref:Uncharacterized protein n=1 Tax=Blattamonas nauphoetae TaxID=2049346 RepID=A0ABQ9Y0Y9_9EUKA|nr:hypothetical protein BLNAU_7557 [Blattamonas nauphoetae]
MNPLNSSTTKEALDFVQNLLNNVQISSNSDTIPIREPSPAHVQRESYSTRRAEISNRDSQRRSIRESTKNDKRTAPKSTKTPSTVSTPISRHPSGRKRSDNEFDSIRDIVLSAVIAQEYPKASDDKVSPIENKPLSVHRLLDLVPEDIPGPESPPLPRASRPLLPLDLNPQRKMEIRHQLVDEKRKKRKLEQEEKEKERETRKIQQEENKRLEIEMRMKEIEEEKKLRQELKKKEEEEKRQRVKAERERIQRLQREREERKQREQEEKERIARYKEEVRIQKLREHRKRQLEQKLERHLATRNLSILHAAFVHFAEYTQKRANNRRIVRELTRIRTLFHVWSGWSTLTLQVMREREAEERRAEADFFEHAVPKADAWRRRHLLQFGLREWRQQTRRQIEENLAKKEHLERKEKIRQALLKLEEKQSTLLPKEEDEPEEPQPAITTPSKTHSSPKQPSPSRSPQLTSPTIRTPPTTHTSSPPAHQNQPSPPTQSQTRPKTATKPHSLTKMEKRALEAKERHRAREERQKQLQQQREEEKRIMDEALRKEAELVKSAQLETNRAMKQYVRQKEEEKKRQAEETKAKLILAKRHSNKQLLRYNIFLPLQHHLQQRRQLEAEMTAHYNHTLSRSVLREWQQATVDIKIERKRRHQQKMQEADSFHNTALLRHAWSEWIRFVQHRHSQLELAAAHHTRSIQRRVFDLWHAEWEEWKQNELQRELRNDRAADELYEVFLKRRGFHQLKRYRIHRKEKKEKEELKAETENKLNDWLSEIRSSKKTGARTSSSRGTQQIRRRLSNPALSSASSSITLNDDGTVADTNYDKFWVARLVFLIILCLTIIAAIVPHFFAFIHLKRSIKL